MLIRIARIGTSHDTTSFPERSTLEVHICRGTMCHFLFTDTNNHRCMRRDTFYSINIASYGNVVWLQVLRPVTTCWDQLGPNPTSNHARTVSNSGSTSAACIMLLLRCPGPGFSLCVKVGKWQASFRLSIATGSL
jgi:hypothetical protein